MTSRLLSVSNLTTSFAGENGLSPVVHGISFNVAAGETVAIVGGSGSGKSVTVMSLMRLLPERTARISGKADFLGRDLLSLPESAMRGIRGNEIAMIFQEPMTSLNPVLTIGFQLAEALRLHRKVSWSDAQAEALRLLDRVKIPAAASRLKDYPHHLSGGMRQRVMIAMALACKPKLLIADEPTTALDVTIQAEILDLIATLQKEEGMSVLFITHDMGVVAEIADRTIVMHKGHIVEEGSTASIFEAPEHPYTRALLAAVPRLGSMKGYDRPARFPQIDIETGKTVPAHEAGDTVDKSAQPVLEVQNLVTRFDIRSGLLRRVSGRIHAVEDVSLTVNRGETLALVGESGSGKSTIGRTIIGLERPVSGTIRLGGDEVVSGSARNMQSMRRKVQMVFQDPFASLNPRTRVGEAIADALVINRIMNRKAARERAKELLVQVGLEAHMVSRFPHEFSGGQRQRICIARALALEPELIVADESVSALDVSVKTQILNLLLDLQERLGISYLFISHDMAVVERVAHRVAVMYMGEIVEIGPRAAIFDNPQHPYTRKLMAAVPNPDPSKRSQKQLLAGHDIRSPFRPVGFVPTPQRFNEVSPGHFVQVVEPA